MFGVLMKRVSCEQFGENQVIQICGCSGASESSFPTHHSPFHHIWRAASVSWDISSDPQTVSKEFERELLIPKPFSLALCRYYSRMLALQIKAMEEGIMKYEDK